MQAVVWTKVNCPHCDQAKLMLKMAHVDYEEKVIDINATKEQLLEVAPFARSVPQIFIDGLLVGGVTELKEKLKNANQ